uniref:Uncharacterized protein n=1 Tax=Lotharella globosa TaxID=91324 RepID=A0A7S3ZGQ0_9EUKA|mmetsp:Transcript_14657/g.29671  ORF Transcript_14657/g.29671 Transcript_14657/m.29671 type:complete len:565 (+) Transcript_14657:92-1786(+)
MRSQAYRPTLLLPLSILLGASLLSLSSFPRPSRVTLKQPVNGNRITRDTVTRSSSVRDWGPSTARRPILQRRNALERADYTNKPSSLRNGEPLSSATTTGSDNIDRFPERESPRDAEIPAGNSGEEEGVDNMDIRKAFKDFKLAQWAKNGFADITGRNLKYGRRFRTYVSDLQHFLQTSPMFTITKDEAISMCDENALDAIRGDGFFSIGNRLAVFALAYLLFPYLQRIVSPTLLGISEDNLASSIVGEFNPVMDVLYALLSADTVGRLQSRQESIQSTVNTELTHLRLLVWDLIELVDESKGIRRLEAAKALLPLWKYTDILIFSSRTGELEKILREDQIFVISHALRRIRKQASATVVGEETTKEDRNQLNYRLQQMEDQIRMLYQSRTQRLDKEGECIAPAVFGILESLSAYIMMSFVVLSASHEMEPTLPLSASSIAHVMFLLGDIAQKISNGMTTTAFGETFATASIGRLIHVNAEGALFAVLVSALVVVRNLYKDLDRPFTGYTHIRRTIATTAIYAIRSDIEATFVREGLTDLVREARETSDKEAKARLDRVTMRLP